VQAKVNLEAFEKPRWIRWDWAVQDNIFLCFR